mgnify:CR=1 FL=1
MEEPKYTVIELSNGIKVANLTDKEVLFEDGSVVPPSFTRMKVQFNNIVKNPPGFNKDDYPKLTLWKGMLFPDARSILAIRHQVGWETILITNINTARAYGWPFVRGCISSDSNSSTLVFKINEFTWF